MGNGISSKLSRLSRPTRAPSSQPESPTAQHAAKPQGSAAAEPSRHAHVDSIIAELGTLDFGRVEEVLASRGLGQEANVRLAIAVDFTKSNEWTGKESFGGRSLHWLPLDSSWNPYEQTIKAVGTAMERFDRANGNKIPCFGFGDVRTQDRDVFSFVPEASCKVAGLQNVLEEYRQITRVVRMAGPTSFAPAIYQAMRSVYKSGNKFHVLLLVADGLIARPPDLPLHLNSVQEQESIEAIVSASSLPLSIVIVGIGDGPWEAMQGFERKIPKRNFNNFRFVNGTDILLKPNYEGGASESQEQREARLALHALHHVPNQYKAAVKLKLVERPVDSSYRRLLKAIRPPLAPPGSELMSLHSQSSLSSAGSTPTLSARASETGSRPFTSFNTHHGSGHLHNNQEPGPITITISATPSTDHSRGSPSTSQAGRPKLKNMHSSQGSLSDHQQASPSSRPSPKSAHSGSLPDDPSSPTAHQPSTSFASEAGPSSRAGHPQREERASKQTYAPPAVPSRLSRSAKYSTPSATDGAGPSRAHSSDTGPYSRSGPLKSRLSISGKPSDPAPSPTPFSDPLPSTTSVSAGPLKSAPPSILTKHPSGPSDQLAVSPSQAGKDGEGSASSPKGNSPRERPGSARTKPAPASSSTAAAATSAAPTSAAAAAAAAPPNSSPKTTPRSLTSSPRASPQLSPALQEEKPGGTTDDEDHTIGEDTPAPASSVHTPAPVNTNGGRGSASRPRSPRTPTPSKPQQQQGTCEISPA